MVNGDSGTPKNTPAPWVPYTRAGCDWGATALANVVLENTGTGPAGDMTKVFGTGSPEWNEAAASNAAPPGTSARNLAQTDFVGLAIHCTTQQLHNYDIAFQQFFERLANDGINKSNTLFVFGVEEGDHFAGAIPTPAGCDGVTTPCHYSVLGEVNGNLQGCSRPCRGSPRRSRSTRTWRRRST
jgi:hypothetical protein